MTIEPDVKDWTWVLDRPCPECGYVAGEVTADRLGEAIRDNATAWEAVLDGLDTGAARRRPRPDVWSPLEYACHVRDVHRTFSGRLRLMLTEDTPTFPNWDQDATALQARYDEQDPAVVGPQLLDAAAEVADRYDGVPPDAWGRRGLRSNGSEFSVESLGRYHLHDVVHHLWDVELRAAGSTTSIPERVRAVLDRFVDLASVGTRVLEIGATPPLLDPQHDRYDAAWAGPELADVTPTDLAEVLRGVRGAMRPGGVLYLSVREDGAPPLRAVLEGAGWEVLEVGHSTGRGVDRDSQVWLDVLARRRQETR